jgi:CRP/FNR family cyclic AMP-dependent transcriptional regulator
MDREQARRAPFLSHSPLFAGLPRRMLGRLATRFLEKAYYPGEFVFHETDPGRALFVVVEGTVEIIQASPQGEHVVRTLVAGDAFGELALIDESPRSGSARIGEQARLLILYKSDFDALMDGEARIAMVVLRNLSRMLASYARRNPLVLTEAAPQPEAGKPKS